MGRPDFEAEGCMQEGCMQDGCMLEGDVLPPIKRPLSMKHRSPLLLIF